jgi:hypothetical protein
MRKLDSKTQLLDDIKKKGEELRRRVNVLAREDEDVYNIDEDGGEELKEGGRDVAGRWVICVGLKCRVVQFGYKYMVYCTQYLRSIKKGCYVVP